MDTKLNNKEKANEKIILPENTQREMMKFFLSTSIPKIAADKQHNSNHIQLNPKTEAVKNG